MDLNDTDTFPFSDNMVDIAVAQGWYNSTTEETFNPCHLCFEKKYDPVMGLYSGRRMWRVFSLINAEYSETADPYVGFTPSTCELLPFSLAPTRQSPWRGSAILSDHYEGMGIRLDSCLSRGLPSGTPTVLKVIKVAPRGSPGGFERPILIYRVAFPP